jgi:hypothetical protein
LYKGQRLLISDTELGGIWGHYRPTQRDDEDALTRAINALASQYGRWPFVLEMLDFRRSWHRGLFHAVKLSA